MSLRDTGGLNWIEEQAKTLKGHQLNEALLTHFHVLVLVRELTGFEDLKSLNAAVCIVQLSTAKRLGELHECDELDDSLKDPTYHTSSGDEDGDDEDDTDEDDYEDDPEDEVEESQPVEDDFFPGDISFDVEDDADTKRGTSTPKPDNDSCSTQAACALVSYSSSSPEENPGSEVKEGDWFPSNISSTLEEDEIQPLLNLSKSSNDLFLTPKPSSSNDNEDEEEEVSAPVDSSLTPMPSSSNDDEDEEEEEVAPVGRRKTACTVGDCTAVVSNFKRHLQQCHPDEDAGRHLASAAARAKWPTATQNCVYPGCSRVVVRGWLYQHFKRYHHMSIKDFKT